MVIVLFLARPLLSGPLAGEIAGLSWGFFLSLLVGISRLLTFLAASLGYMNEKEAQGDSLQCCCLALEVPSLLLSTF